MQPSRIVFASVPQGVLACMALVQDSLPHAQLTAQLKGALGFRTAAFRMRSASHTPNDIRSNSKPSLERPYSFPNPENTRAKAGWKLP